MPSHDAWLGLAGLSLMPPTHVAAAAPPVPAQRAAAASAAAVTAGASAADDLVSALADAFGAGSGCEPHHGNDSGGEEGVDEAEEDEEDEVGDGNAGESVGGGGGFAAAAPKRPSASAGPARRTEIELKTLARPMPLREDMLTPFEQTVRLALSRIGGPAGGVRVLITRLSEDREIKRLRPKDVGVNAAVATVPGVRVEQERSPRTPGVKRMRLVFAVLAVPIIAGASAGGGGGGGGGGGANGGGANGGGAGGSGAGWTAGGRKPPAAAVVVPAVTGAGAPSASADVLAVVAAAAPYVVVPGAAVAASPAFELFARAVRHALAMWRAPQMLLEQLALDAEVKRLKNAILAGFSSFRGAVAAVEAVRVTSRVSTLCEVICAGTARATLSRPSAPSP
jgi:hypothetical protein